MTTCRRKTDDVLNFIIPKRCRIARSNTKSSIKEPLSADVASKLPPPDASKLTARERTLNRSGTTDPARTKENAVARQFALDLARVISDTRSHQVVVLDVMAVSPVTDFFVIASGTSARQLRAAIDAAEELGHQRNYGRMTRSGDDSSNWLILDCVDVIVHLFTQDARSYYDIDSLWGDAKRLKWERE